MKSFGKALLALVITAALSVGLLWGTEWLTSRLDSSENHETGKNIYHEWLKGDRYESLKIDGTNAVTAAYRALSDKGQTLGYGVTASVKGYHGMVEVHCAFASDGVQLIGISIGQHQESQGYGARITEESFTEQFTGLKTPVTLTGKSAALKDGTYRAEDTEEDYNGYRNTVELTVKNGEITTVSWDAVDAEGNSKKELSRAGQYKMTEDGLWWYQQAELLEKELLRLQDPAKLVYNPDTGKTDAYAGASIAISPFVTLAKQALQKAKPVAEGATVDGISGATISSTAVVTAVNDAAAFLKETEETVS